MEETDTLASDSDVVCGKFRNLYQAFQLHQQCSAQGLGTLPIENLADGFRVPPDPYPGLRSFTPQEGGVFFGRERNVNEVRQRLADRNFAVILGSSGSGKSSLIKAGLIPRLNSTKGIHGRSGNWYAAEFRPRLHPVDELARSLELLVNKFFPSQVTDTADTVKGSYHSECLERLRSKTNGTTQADRSQQAEALSNALFDFVDVELNRLDLAASHGLRSGKPSLLLVVDQFEEVFRPEVAMDQDEGGRRLLDLVITTCATLAQGRRALDMQSGLFLVITMRSEELHRCTEYPSLPVHLKQPPITYSLADLVNSGVYLLDLLDPQIDRDELREAIVRPARRVFVDWGLPLDEHNEDAPFAAGVVDWLLEGAVKLSLKLEHRPDQLPLLQHALQTIWRGAMDDWASSIGTTDHDSRKEHLIRKEHLRWLRQKGEAASAFPDLAACLDWRADTTAREAVDQFARASTTSANPRELGEQIIRGAFRALAQRDDHGNWARRFADAALIKTFLLCKSPLLGGIRLDEGIQTALSSFVNRGYLVLKDGYYDISHEALIRNWKQYQDWLRDPQEISNALSRAIADLNPERLTAGSRDADDDLLGGLPPSMCDTLNKLFEKRELPQSWASNQILPIVNRTDVASRWGTKKPTEVLKRLADLVTRAQSIRVARANARLSRQRNRRLAYGAGAVIVSLAAIGVAWYWKYEAQINQARSIALHARDELDYEGPARAILLAMEAAKKKLPDIPETEQVIYRSLRQLREKRALLAPEDQDQDLATNPKGDVAAGPTQKRSTIFVGVAANPKGDVVAGLTQNGSILFWNPADGSFIDRYNLDQSSVQTYGIQWSPDGKQLAIGVGDRTEIVIPCSHSRLRPFFASCAEDQTQDVVWLSPPGVKAGPGKFSQDGKWLITANWKAQAQLWNLDTRKNTELNVDTSSPWAVALAPDMRIAAVGTPDPGIVKIVELSSSGRVEKVTDVKMGDKNSSIISLDFGKDPNLLLVSTQNNHVWVLDLTTAASKPALNQNVTAFQTAFSRDGSHIAAGSPDGVLRVWSIDHLDQPSTLRGHKGPIYSLQFTQDGRTLVSASADGTIRIWSMDAALHPQLGRSLPQESGTSERKSSVPKDNSEVTRAVSRDGYTLVAYNGSPTHLALFGPEALFGLYSNSVPIAEWGGRINAQWSSVAFEG